MTTQDVLSQSFPLVADPNAANPEVNQGLSFSARTVVAQNPTGQWWYVPACYQYVPPGALNYVMRCIASTRNGQVLARTPAGATSAPGAGELATFIFVEEALQPTSGYSTTPTGTISGPLGIGTPATSVRVVDASSAIATGRAAPNDTVGGTLVSPAAATQRAITISNTGANDMYIGIAGVTTATGKLVKAGNSTFPIRTTAAIYAICAAGLATTADYISEQS